jgi:hypothetical protein
MDSGDILFYVVIAISVVGSISKAFKKKTNVEDESIPSKTGAEIFRKIVQEMQRGDDFIPVNPKPVVVKAQTRNVEHSFSASEVERGQYMHSTSRSENVLIEPIEEEECEFLSSLNFSDSDEIKKAFIYSEILKTKF